MSVAVLSEAWLCHVIIGLAATLASAFLLCRKVIDFESWSTVSAELSID